MDGFVGESAAAGLLPSEVLVKKTYSVARASELFATHCARRPAANDCYFGHNFLSRSPASFSRGDSFLTHTLLTASDDGLLGYHVPR